MSKRLVAVLPLLVVLTLALAGSASAPTVAAPAASSVSAPATMDLNGSTPDAWGTCRWYCGSKSYSTAAACDAACSFECEPIC